MRIIPTILFAPILMATIGVQGQKRIQIDLNKNWSVTSVSPGEDFSSTEPDMGEEPWKWYTGDMPRQVQELILDKGELPDPTVRDNCFEWVEVFQKDWIYVKEFKTPDHQGNIHLCFDGLDTEVDVFLNGNKMAYCNNMHRRWKVPVDGKLNPAGEANRLILRFYPPQKVIDKFVARYPGADVVPHKYIRKTESDFKSYMGARPHFMKVGIFDDVYLDVLPEAFFGDIHVQSVLAADYSSADIHVDTDIQDLATQIIDYEVFSPDNVLLRKGKESAGKFSIRVDDPQLWYPMNFGEQPMYKIRLSMRDHGELLDEDQIEFGIRDVQIVQEDQQTGKPLFCIQVNGRRIFMNGACWAPLHGFSHVWDKERAERLLQLMRLGNMNFTRVWGEGSLPGKSFFEFCDRNGIMVMMDFMTSSPIRHPIHDPGFLENITLEIEDVIKRFRNHPCIAFWDGGNEHYLFAPSNRGDNTLPVGRALFQKIMPDAVARLDPQRYFHPSSPWGGDDWFNGNHPLRGDFHDYSTARFQPLNTVPLFTTEVCMVSPYAAHNMRKFMSEEELWPDEFKFTIDTPGKKAWPPGWEHHSLGSAWAKTGRIQDYCDIQDVEDACRVFGMAHGQYLKERYERQRRGVPDGKPDGYRRSWGAAVWRLHDSWPMIYMSVVDYYLEPKIPYYFLKRACEPLLISFEQTDDRIRVWVINDTPGVVEDSLIVELHRFSGEEKKRCSRMVRLQPSESKIAIDLTNEFYEINKRDEFLVARFGDKIKTHLLWPEKFLQLKRGKINVELQDGNLVLEADRYITCVQLSIPDVSGAVFSDNYFELFPGEIKRIRIIDPKEGDQIMIEGLNSDKVVKDL